MLTSMKRLKLWFAATLVALSFSLYTSTSFGEENIYRIHAYCGTEKEAVQAIKLMDDYEKYIKYMAKGDNGCIDYLFLFHVGMIPVDHVAVQSKPVLVSKRHIDKENYVRDIYRSEYEGEPIYTWKLANDGKPLDNI